MTIKQRVFIQRYLKYRNATLAVLDIYDTSNKSSAAVIGSRLLRNVKVKQEIDSIIEAERSLPVSVALLLKEMLETGTWKAKAEALKMAMKIYGYY